MAQKLRKIDVETVNCFSDGHWSSTSISMETLQTAHCSPSLIPTAAGQRNRGTTFLIYTKAKDPLPCASMQKTVTKNLHLWIYNSSWTSYIKGLMLPALLLPHFLFRSPVSFRYTKYPWSPIPLPVPGQSWVLRGVLEKKWEVLLQQKGALSRQPGKLSVQEWGG